MYSLLVDGSGPEGAFSWVDHRVGIPGDLVLSLTTLAAALIVLWAGYVGRLRLAAISVLSVVGLSLIVREVAPAIVQHTGTDASARQRERPYLATRAAFTRRAFAVDRHPRADSTIAYPSVADALPWVSVWDPPALTRAVDGGRSADDQSCSSGGVRRRADWSPTSSTHRPATPRRGRPGARRASWPPTPTNVARPIRVAGVGRDRRSTTRRSMRRWYIPARRRYDHRRLADAQRRHAARVVRSRGSRPRGRCRTFAFSQPIRRSRIRPSSPIATCAIASRCSLRSLPRDDRSSRCWPATRSTGQSISIPSRTATRSAPTSTWSATIAELSPPRRRGDRAGVDGRHQHRARFDARSDRGELGESAAVALHDMGCAPAGNSHATRSAD